MAQKSRRIGKQHCCQGGGGGGVQLGPPGAQIRELVTAAQIYYFHTEGVGVTAKLWSLFLRETWQQTGPSGPGLLSSAAPAEAFHSQDQHLSVGFGCGTGQQSTAEIGQVPVHTHSPVLFFFYSFEAVDVHSFGLQRPDTHIMSRICVTMVK